MKTEYVMIKLTVREAEQLVSGKPDERSWRSVRRKANKALHDHQREQATSLCRDEDCPECGWPETHVRVQNGAPAPG